MLLSQENKYLRQNISDLKAQNNLLAGLAERAIEKTTHINIENKATVNDNSRSISNSTLQNSAVNLGNNSTVNNRIQHLRDSQKELKDVLLQLVALLEKAPIAESDKQTVEKAIDNLTEVAAQPAEEGKQSSGEILSTLEKSIDIFKELPDLGLKYGELIARLVEMFN